MEITEFKERPNTHQTHFEDLVLLGQDGLEELNDKIDKFIAEINGGQDSLNTSTKIDGAPAVVCWSKFPGYPDNSICLKSFITSNKNCLSSSEDIQAKYGDRPDMAEKLLYCLKLAPSIPENEAWQGDCLYTKGDLKEKEIQGTNYLTFHPNKIIYAFSEDNPTYETIKNSNFGICFHTIYKPAAEGKKTQSFRVDAKRLNNVPEDIYVMSPALNKSTNKADYNLDEVIEQYKELKNIEAKLLSNSDYEDLCDNKVFMSYWNTFENANLSDKEAVNIDVNTFFDELKAYIKDKQQKAYDKKMSTLKTDAGKQKATNAYNAEVIEIEDILDTNKEVIVLLVKALNLAANIKMNLWNGFKKADQGYNTFYKSRTKGYIPANMEGVAMSDQDGNIVKVVDRSTFSHANRSDDYESGFEHNESLEEEKVPVNYLPDDDEGIYRSYRCDNCGAGVRKGANKCWSCGAELDWSDYIDESADWVKNTVNTVQNTDKDPNVIATKEYHNMKVKKPKKGAVITATPGLVGEGLNEEKRYIAPIRDTANALGCDPELLETGPMSKGRTPIYSKANGATVAYVRASNGHVSLTGQPVGESLNEAVSKTVIMAFGRMNPPTVGHNKLIDTMAQAATKYNADAKLYLSHTQDSKKNPLSYDQKIYYADKAFGDRVGVVDSQAKTIIQVLQELNKEYDNLIYVGGEDRIGGEEDITNTIKKYNGNPEENPKAVYNFDNIEFINAGGRNSSSDDFLETVSASMVRDLVRKGDLETFKKCVPFDDATAEQLFDDVKAGLNLSEGLEEEVLGESNFSYADVNKHSYYNDVINNFLTNGIVDNAGNIFKVPDDADKEAIKQKLLDIQPEFKDKKDIFKEIVGQDWTKIDKSPYSGKGGDKGQSAGQHAEPLVCYLFNGGDIADVEASYSKEWVKSSIDSAKLISSNWNNKQFIAAHVDGDNISNIPDNAKNIASIFKSKFNAEEVLGLEKGTLNGLYARNKDDWCKADIVLVNKKANIKNIFSGVFNEESLNDALNIATKNNLIIPISLKGLDPKTKAHLEFVSNSIKLDTPGELKIELPKKDLKSNDNNCTCWLISDIGRIQFRRQSDTEDRLSIEVQLSKTARGGKGVSKIQQELNLGGDWLKHPIKSEKALIQNLRQITPNIIGNIPVGTPDYPGYNRTCFRGLVNLYKAYTKKYKNSTAGEMFIWVMDNCVKSAVDYYKVS